MISIEDIEMIRSIARAGDNYDAIKRLLAGTRWEIEEDEVDLGFLRIFIPDATDEFYRLIIGYRDPNHPPYLILSFSVFPDLTENLAAFDSVFKAAAETLSRPLGTPAVTGKHQLKLRDWPYAYQRWSLPEGEFTLVQEELDIQEGMDVSLWIQPVGTPIDKTLQI
jgi:hypothetical protein